MILFGEKLVKTLREHCDSAQKRIWIASPFIGHLNDIERILGLQWKNKDLDRKVLIDVDAGFIMDDTFSAFYNAGMKIKSLLSLHAKIYIVDDWCLVTSANLTGTAFSMRYEVGEDSSSIETVAGLFEAWWNLKECRIVNNLPEKKHTSLIDYQVGNTYGFTEINSLPDRPKVITIPRPKKKFTPTVIKRIEDCIDLYYRTWNLYHVDKVFPSKPAGVTNTAEGYKWAAYKDAENDFSGGRVDMGRLFEGCFETSWNLLAGNMYYPRRMLKKLCISDEDMVRANMERLFDEESPLENRIREFLDNMLILTKKAKKNYPERFNAKDPTSQQSIRSVSVYLALRYRTNHYLYKPRLYQDFAKLIGAQIVETDAVKKYLEYESFCDGIRAEIENHSDLMKRCVDTFGNNEFNSYLMTQDMMYCVIRWEKENS